MTIGHTSDVPQVFRTFSDEVRRFSDSLSRLSIEPDRADRVAVGAGRLAGLTSGLVAHLGRSGTSQEMLEKLGREIEPLVEALNDMVTGFDWDTCQGQASLPDWNDESLARTLLDWPAEDVVRLGRLVAGAPYGWTDPDRSVLREALADAGVPPHETEPGLGGTIKITILVIVALIALYAPRKLKLILVIVSVMVRIDRDGHEGHCSCGGDDGVTPVDFDPDFGCGGPVTVLGIGCDPDPVKSAEAARSDADAEADKECPDGCTPTPAGIQRLRTVRQPNGTFCTAGVYDYRCT